MGSFHSVAKLSAIECYILLPVAYSHCLPEGLGENLLDSKAIVDLLWMIVSF